MITVEDRGGQEAAFGIGVAHTASPRERGTLTVLMEMCTAVGSIRPYIL